jgi:hypothetical protein
MSHGYPGQNLLSYFYYQFAYNIISHKNHAKNKSIATLLIPTRIAKMKQGRLQELCNEAFAFPDATPHQQLANPVSDDDEPSFDNATQFCPEAQAAANSNNLHTAYQRVLSSLPIVKLHSHVIDRIKHTLFPPRLPKHTAAQHSQPLTASPPRVTRAQHNESSKSNLFRQITTDDTLATLRKTKRGTAPGPFCDPIDSLRGYATFRPSSALSKRHRLQPVQQQLRHVPLHSQLHCTSTACPRWRHPRHMSRHL